MAQYHLRDHPSHDYTVALHTGHNSNDHEEITRVQKKWPTKVNNLTYSPREISVLFRLNWFHGSSKDDYIHCIMKFP